MRGQMKTGTTMLDNIKGYLKNAGAFLFGSDDEIGDGYTDVMDIPDPTVENYPEEREFITKSAKLEKIVHEKSKKIDMTSRNSVKENEAVNKKAEEKRRQMEIRVNEDNVNEYGERA